ncbi:MAG: prolyl oligopeptidase family serine peptidase [Acidobacteriota bacterium]
MSRYPPARLGDDVDDFHGTAVADPYRWLEDAGAPETARWVEAQNALTAAWLDTPFRAEAARRLATLFAFPRVSVPILRGSRRFFTVHDGVDPQPRLFVQQGDAPARLLLDVNRLSADGTTALTGVWPSRDGELVAIALSIHGSDWQEIGVLETASGRERPDRLRWAKFTEVAWLPDGSGFLYTRFPEPGTVPAGDEHYFGRVCLHELGEPQAADRLVYHRPDDGSLVPSAQVSWDGTTIILTVHRGASDESEVFVAPVGAPDAARPVFTGFTAAFDALDLVEGRLLVRTTLGAPRGRVVAVDLGAGTPRLDEVVPEGDDTLHTARVAGGRLACAFLHHASDEVRVFELDGRPAGRLPLGRFVSLSGLSGTPEHPELFARVSGFTTPPTVWRCGVSGATAQPWWPEGSPAPARAPDGLVTEQVWYPSKDGTRISMFLVRADGTPRDGQRPVLLTGYGGFNISVTPQYDPSLVLWIERGGVAAVPNLRGGGEYGESWHRAGMLERKQNVFDDCIAAAEWLVREGYTRSGRIALEGGSNGGLLVGAVLVQRPDLLGAAVCRVPVADMLRYHRFTVGRFWVPEYGSADDPAQFPFLYAYSPLHNVRDGTPYPPTLVMTADTDDRVAPGMAKKFAARLQAAAAPGSGPILLRVETRAGHGAGKPVAKQVAEEADIHAFLARALGPALPSSGSDGA